MKLSDYVFKRLPALTGSSHCFTLSGGGIMHLLDSCGRSPGIRLICLNHEQAAVIAADACGRVHNTTGIALVTSGPGASNAVTGVAGAWMESTPLFVISGQVSRASWKGKSGVRQMGFQEIDIVPIVSSITKYAVTVLEPSEIRYHMEKAAYLARHGRPGPVWLDIPLDVQSAQIDPGRMKGFDPAELPQDAEPLAETRKKVASLLTLLENSRRPLLIGGHGVLLSGAGSVFKALAKRLNIPLQTSWNAIDLVEEDFDNFFGRSNSYGPRYPNFIVQNCDLLISIGCRLGIQHTGFNVKAFARGARKAVVDIDPRELRKHIGRADLPFRTDAKVFINCLLSEIKKTNFSGPAVGDWKKWCLERKAKYPVCGPEYSASKRFVDPYVFCEALSDAAPEGALITPGSSGTGFTVSSQVWRIKKGQRYFMWKGLASMGYGLPASIGASVGAGNKDAITIIGDGGFQLNIQELATVVHYKLPVKFFVFNNNGYLSIRVSQKAYFNGRLFGSSPESGVGLPELRKIAAAYGIDWVMISGPRGLKQNIVAVLKRKGPVICEVMLDPDKTPLPKLSSYQLPDGSMASRPLEDMFPLLSREELRSNMIIDLLEEKNEQG